VINILFKTLIIAIIIDIRFVLIFSIAIIVLGNIVVTNVLNIIVTQILVVVLGKKIVALDRVIVKLDPVTLLKAVSLLPLIVTMQTLVLSMNAEEDVTIMI